MAPPVPAATDDQASPDRPPELPMDTAVPAVPPSAVFCFTATPGPLSCVGPEGHFGPVVQVHVLVGGPGAGRDVPRPRGVEVERIGGGARGAVELVPQVGP